LEIGFKLNENNTLLYEVDKIDNYLSSYDLLPTIGLPLVSIKFKNIFENLNNDIQFIGTKIINKKKNVNEEFYALNIFNTLPVMDMNKSKYEYDKYGNINIKSLYIKKNSLKEHSIIRMEEHDSYIIVTEEFKSICEKAELRGIDFEEEGKSIYTNV
jgi:hypothetical protein